MYVENIAVSRRMSTRPSSAANCNKRMSSCYLWTPSEVSSTDTSRSGRYPMVIGVLHFDCNLWLTLASSCSTFLTVALTYLSDVMHQHWTPLSSMTDDVAPRYMTEGSVLSSFNLNMACTAVKTSFTLWLMARMSSTKHRMYS